MTGAAPPASTAGPAPRVAISRWTRSGSAWEALAVGVFTLWIAWPFLAPGGFVTDYDTVRYSGPNLAATFGAWSEHRLPLWEPGIFGGTAFAANVQTAVFYPLKVLFWPLGAPVALGAMTAAHLFLLAFGMRHLARRTLRLAPPAGLVAAVVMVGSGTTMVRAVRFEQIAVVAWIPWLLVALDAIVAAPVGRRARPVAAGAAVTALVVLSGHPNQALIGAALAAVWVVVRLRDHRPDGSVAALARVGAASLLGLGIAALPVVLALPLFRRMAVSPDVMLEEASSDRYTLWPAHLVSTFLGDVSAGPRAVAVPTVETPAFVGVGALLLAVVGAVVWTSGGGQDRQRATAWGLVSAAAISIVVALGPSFGLYRLAAAVIPGFGNGRVPVRWLFITTLAVALLAAAGASALVRNGFGAGWVRRSWWAPGAAIAVVMVASVAPPWGGDAPTVGARTGWLIVAALAVTAGVAVRRPDARRGIIVGLFALAVVVELGLPARASYAWSLRTDRSFAVQGGPIDGFLAEQGARALVVGPTDVNANLTAGWRTLDGYDGGLWLTDSYVAAAERLTDGPFRPLERLGQQVRLPLDADALAEVGIRYVVVDAAARQRVIAGWAGPVLVDGGREVWANPQYRGEGYFTADGPAPAVRRPEPGVIELTTAAGSSGGRLVVTEQALPGWTATVDDRPTSLVDADGFALAAEIPAGAHEVRFAYHPPGFAVGAAVSLLSLLAMVVLALLPRRPRRPRRSGRARGQRPMRRDPSSSSGTTGRSGTTTT